MKPQQKEYFFMKNTQKNLDIKNIVFTFEIGRAHV